jgi:DNA-binding transcriptional LysR family regulator
MSSPRITLEQWQALTAVVDAGSYAKASEALHKSQSAVTYAVQKLESVLGVKAFAIEGRKATLTPTGQLLYRRALALLGEARSLEHAASSVSAGWEPEIGVAVEMLFPSGLALRCLNRFGLESPHTRIELIESVLAGTTEALLRGHAQLAIGGQIPQGFVGDPLVRLRLIAVAHPDHPLHKLGRQVTLQDLRPYRQLVVRESDAKRASNTLAVEAPQRWTVTHVATSIEAVRSGFGFGWYAEDRVRPELVSGALKILPLREGGTRFAQLYLMFADRENAGPGTLRLAQIIREEVAAS